MHKRTLAVHDISCIGRCSLTVALPILSAAGIETSVLPTAVLSTHTGNFQGYTFRDLTDDIQPICNHWKSLDIKFDSIYTGYLGSFKQIKLIKNLFESFKNESTFILVDPVMGDNGKLYSNLTNDFAEGFKELCSQADVITPNITEACLMLGCEYPTNNYDEQFIENIVKALADLGPDKIVLTGVSFSTTQLGCAIYDREKDKVDFIFEKKVEGFFHGTGDVFASALLANLMNNKSLLESAKSATKFTAEAIRRTKLTGAQSRYGVDFEDNLAEFGIEVKK